MTDTFPPVTLDGAAARGQTVADAFDRAARRYDLMVGLNPGYHRHLRSAARSLLQAASSPSALLDLGCGSGASTAALLSCLDPGRPRPELVGIDASAGMLARARAKSWPDGVRFCPGRAEELADRRADWGLTGPVDGVLAAYLLRNVSARDAVLAAIHDVLRPGGVLVVQDYSVAGSPAAALVWSLVCWLVVIPLALLTSRDARLYRYLWRSVLRFDPVPQFADRLWQAGFVDVEVRTVPGWQHGILHTFRARRP